MYRPQNAFSHALIKTHKNDYMTIGRFAIESDATIKYMPLGYRQKGWLEAKLALNTEMLYFYS